MAIFHLTQSMEVFKMKRRYRIIIFIFILVISYLYMCLIFTPKDIKDYGGENYYTGTLYSEEKKNTLDVVAIGNSDLYSSLIPTELYGKYGFTTYNCGSNKQRPSAGFYFLKDIMKDHDVKLLIIEMDFIYENRVSFDQQQLGNARFLLSPFIYHAKWKKLKASDFYKFPSPSNDVFKGYRLNKKVYKVKNRDYMIDKKERIPEKNLKEFDEMMKYCKKNNIQILCYEAPSLSSWNRTKSQQVTELCEKYGIKYIDFNLKMEEIRFDLKTDFRDNGNHCNFSGAYKITTYLGKIINEEYQLPNHFGDKMYKHWDEAYQIYLDKLKEK